MIVTRDTSEIQSLSAPYSSWESCKTKRKVPKGNLLIALLWVETEILPLSVPYTDARASSPLSRVCCAILERIFWNAVQKEH